ncbi:MAG: hypothetical protein AAF389_04055 [Gemmatimonadota bacterium]
MSHPGERYVAEAAARTQEVDELRGRARSIEITRLVLFVVGAVAGLLRNDVPVPAPLVVVVSVLALVGFAVLVVRHRAVRARLRRAEARRLLAQAGTHRRHRNWEGLATEYDDYGYEDPLLAPLAGTDERHPYLLDLDLFGPASVRGLMGPTPTAVGNRTLESWLVAPTSAEDIRRRHGAVRALAEAVDAREERTVEALLLRRMPEEEWQGFEAWLRGPAVFGDTAAVLPGWSRVVSWVMPALSLPLFALWSVGDTLPWWSWGGLWAVQFALTWVWSARLTPFLSGASRHSAGVRGHHALFRSWEQWPVDAPEIRSIVGRLSGGSGAAASEEIRSLERWLDAAESRASMIYHVVSPLVFWDVHVAWGLERWRRRAGANAPAWFEALGELEALSALATLAWDEPEWAAPTIVEGEAAFRAEGLGHPLIPREDRRVSDVALDPPGGFLLVTGSNMSGKSTLLRSIGLGAVLAQAGSVVCARSLELSPLRTFTSMRIRDSLTGGVSLFMAELLRLKALVDAADVEGEGPLLYLVDEVLQGTNSEERRIAARRIVAHLLGADAIGAVTTHDLALHDDPALDPASKKVHFRETVGAEGEKILTFDYVLRPGLATSRNALRLLEIVGLG